MANSFHLDEKFTILLLLRDRHKFTERFLDFYLKLDERPKLYIADGSLEKYNISAELILEKKLAYRYFGPDITIKDFSSKTFNALQEINTPYIMMFSNDDFLIPENIYKSIEFLECNNDFVLSTGKYIDFKLSSEDVINGSIEYMKDFRTFNVIDSNSVLDRLITLYKNGVPSYWHSIIRRESLVKAWENALIMEVNRYDILELFINTFLCLEGKFNTISDGYQMFHQVHNDMMARLLPSFEENITDYEFVYELTKFRQYLMRQMRLEAYFVESLILNLISYEINSIRSKIERNQRKKSLNKFKDYFLNKLRYFNRGKIFLKNKEIGPYEEKLSRYLN